MCSLYEENKIIEIRWTAISTDGIKLVNREARIARGLIKNDKPSRRGVREATKRNTDV